jgi:hypothetical protein
MDNYADMDEKILNDLESENRRLRFTLEQAQNKLNGFQEQAMRKLRVNSIIGVTLDNTSWCLPIRDIHHTDNGVIVYVDLYNYRRPK